MHIAAGGAVGYHQAVARQLFLIVRGEGWVAAGEERTRVPLRAGDAALWEPGEWHEAGSNDGMTTIVIEGPGIDASAVMAPKHTA